MLHQFVGLGEIPFGSLRLIVTASAHDRGTGVLVEILVGPLPDVSDKVHYAKRTCTIRMSENAVGPAHGAPLVWQRYGGCIPYIAPRVETPVRSLSGILPFPFVR